MTEVQGWIAILVGVIGVITVIVRVNTLYVKLEMEVSRLADAILDGFKRNDEFHKKLEVKVTEHGRVLIKHGEAIAVLGSDRR